MKRIAIVATVSCIAANMATAKSPMPDYSSLSTTTEAGGKRADDSANAYRGTLNEVPCNVANVIDALANVNTPTTKSEAEKSGEFRQVSESESIFHNFREGVLTEASSRDEISRMMGKAVVEYWLERAGMMSKSEWRVLDPDMPNAKYVSRDGLKEAVYSRHTGEKVESGINAGTANAAIRSLALEHWYRYAKQSSAELIAEGAIS